MPTRKNIDFEVHGPRLNRYANLWAWYLGHQWIYRRELGEPQVTFNWSKAFSDFITNFCFAKGVVFHAPPQNEAIIPEVLREVWEVQNDKEKLLWEIGANGGVSGDSFIKVAYEEEYVDPAGNFHPPKVRILPLNSAFCVDEDTEILTREGWKDHTALTTEDEVLTLDLETDQIRWEQVERVNRFDWDGPVTRWSNERFEAITTDDHRWVVEDWRVGNPKYRHLAQHRIKTTGELNASRQNGMRLITGGGHPRGFADAPKWSDEFVETVGWYVTEGHLSAQDGALWITQSHAVNPANVERIRALLGYWEEEGAAVGEYSCDGRATQFRLRDESLLTQIEIAAPKKRLQPSFLTSLTYAQALLLYDTLMAGDGGSHATKGTVATAQWFQSSTERIADFQMLCAMLGKRTQVIYRDRLGEAHPYNRGNDCEGVVTIYSNRTTNVSDLKKERFHKRGIMWCPTTPSGTWFARKKGTMPKGGNREVCFWTGNCFPEWHPHDRNRLIRFKLKYRFWGTALEGTRQVFTYTELMTEDSIQEFVNDELIDSRENPIGTIPVVHIANTMVPGSPWGLADIQDITELNRLYNETATLLTDIINYYAAPVTVVTGAKQNNLERGPKKVWTVPNENAKIQNLASQADIPGVISFLQTIKVGMHEITGVPESALGQAQPVSNTSGVALSIMYQPLMNRFHQKSIQYGGGLKRVNELVLRYLALYEPWRFRYDPTLDAELQPGQLDMLDIRDPLTYETTCEFSPPLPIDHLVALNEIQLMMGLGLESKVGALRRLGEAYPHEKLQELYDELVSDAKQAGALDLLKRQIDQLLWELGGPPVGGDPTNPGGGGVVSAGGNEVTSAGSPAPPSVMQVDPGKGTEELYNALTTLAAGTKLPQRRAPDSTNPSNPG